MSLPNFSMRQLLEAGVHFGHKPRRWNPKMAPYIFGERHNVHILDLQQTVPLLKEALQALHNVASAGGRILFVGTKHQASKIVAEAAKRCGQYYINHRWFGGTLTNWKTISNSIDRLKSLNQILEQEDTGLTKKETLKLAREREKLEAALGGIMDMGNMPDMVVVIDVNKDDIAVQESNKLGIPVVGIIDTNSSPEGITFPIPGNDDAIKAIDLYCQLFASAVISGIEKEMSASGVDLGEAEVVVDEALVSALEGGDTVEKNTPAKKAAPKKESATPKPSEEVEKATPKKASTSAVSTDKDAAKEAQSEEDAPLKKVASKEA